MLQQFAMIRQLRGLSITPVPVKGTGPFKLGLALFGPSLACLHPVRLCVCTFGPLLSNLIWGAHGPFIQEEFIHFSPNIASQNPKWTAWRLQVLSWSSGGTWMALMKSRASGSGPFSGIGDTDGCLGLQIPRGAILANLKIPQIS